MDASRLTGPPMSMSIAGKVLPMVGRVRMYVCGITPYDVTHLGHAATYVWADLADRVLSWHGHTVVVARNITDVDEVLFAEARRRGEQSSMLATLQRASFERTMSTLRVRTPDHSPTAAQAVGQVIQLATALLTNNQAYLRGGTVFARTAVAAEKAGLDREAAIERSREYHDHPEHPDKDDPLDVAVWVETTDDDEVSWPSPWGPGRPGWHAECAAMVLTLFGPSVDLHCGGADLFYPHHACESALAEAATGVAPFARAWMRAGQVNIGTEKMAKSTGNLVLVDDLLKTHSPAAIRLLCLARPWADQWSYSPELLDQAAATLDELYTAAGRSDSGAGGAAVPAALNNNLDVPTALSIALEDGGQAARSLIEILALS